MDFFNGAVLQLAPKARPILVVDDGGQVWSTESGIPGSQLSVGQGALSEFCSATGDGVAKCSGRSGNR